MPDWLAQQTLKKFDQNASLQTLGKFDQQTKPLTGLAGSWDGTPHKKSFMHVSGGMLLFFPFSWHGWQLRVIQCDNYYVALIAILLACVIYIISKYYTGEEHRESIDK